VGLLRAFSFFRFFTLFTSIKGTFNCTGKFGWDEVASLRACRRVIVN
jgi:hypothetical protein